MTSVYRVTALWNGFQGAPGYSRFSFDNLVDAASLNAAGSELTTFFTAMRAYMLTTWSIQVQPQVDEYDMATGVLLGSHLMTSPPAAVSGQVAAATNWVGGAGACVTWNTGLIFAGRRVRGRTFLVPLAGQGDVDGSLLPAFLSAMGPAATTLAQATAAKLAVWAKTYDGSTPPQQTGGILADVVSGTIKDATSTLRSRRT